MIYTYQKEFSAINGESARKLISWRFEHGGVSRYSGRFLCTSIIWMKYKIFYEMLCSALNWIELALNWSWLHRMNNPFIFEQWQLSVIKSQLLGFLWKQAVAKMKLIAAAGHLRRNMMADLQRQYSSFLGQKNLVPAWLLVFSPFYNNKS